MKFEKLKFEKLYDGVQAIIEFGKYEVSVVSHSYSYGGKKGLWEMAVLDSEGSLCYDTEITDDVLGHLNDPEVDRYLRMISQL